jgi:cation diffusion facilitator CzcD-associated flavoprotein CzcO
VTEQAYTEKELDELAAAARRDLARVNYPPGNWVLPTTGPDGRTALDVLVVGAGMCGQTAAFALLREGVTNIRIVDRAPRGLEGPWGTFARMETLRSPKHLTGPDLGIPLLTFRAWFEAQHGESSWQELYKVARLDWLAYLMWVRDVVGIPVENETEVLRLFPADALIGADVVGSRGQETIYARKIVLACGREGSGGRRMPSFATESKRLFHASDLIDFTRFRGGRMAVLGASASAVDNAATALEAGVPEVTLFVRRPYFPQVNKSKWASFPGFMRGYAALDDARRWAFYTYILGEGTPPPHESVLRCTRNAGFRIHFGESWTAVNDTVDGIAIKTTNGSYTFDAAVVAIGFDVDLVQRHELASFREYILTWGDRVAPEQAAAHPEAARFPYLGDGMQMLERQIGTMPTLGSLHVFNWGVTMSHGALAGDIPGLGIGATRLANAIVRDLFVADGDEYFARMQVQEDDELKPTDFFVPHDKR